MCRAQISRVPSPGPCVVSVDGSSRGLGVVTANACLVSQPLVALWLRKESLEKAD